MPVLPRLRWLLGLQLWLLHLVGRLPLHLLDSITLPITLKPQFFTSCGFNVASLTLVARQRGRLINLVGGCQLLETLA
jgi:hypothetical protein